MERKTKKRKTHMSEKEMNTMSMMASKRIETMTPKEKMVRKNNALQSH